jgi:hypothetical protein
VTGRPAPGQGETGSATVEFVLVAVLTVTIFLAVLQVGLAVHVRNTLVAAAAEGARYGASAGRTPSDAARQTSAVITTSLPAAYAEQVSAGYETVEGVPTVVVRVRAPLPVLGLAGPGGDLVVAAHALAEVAPVAAAPAAVAP